MMSLVQLGAKNVYALSLVFFLLTISQNWAKPSGEQTGAAEENDEETHPVQKPRTQETIRVDLIRNEIIPEFFFTPPKYETFVTYHDGSMPNMGNTLRPDQVKYEPHTVTYHFRPDCFYTVVMTGLDEPSKETPSKREFLYWIVGNIPADNLIAGETKTQYYPVLPKINTGLHRYLFLVYEQKNKIDFKEPPLTNRNDWGRANWSSRKFAEKYQLGEPYAVNFFYSKHWNETLIPTTTETDTTSMNDSQPADE